ncbi:MAG TPA: cysteine desulfurase family protein [Kineosporiaceae bacterium]|nr:cysteine desulfurase family protein [Kineosporiaceae bacterium]
MTAYLDHAATTPMLPDAVSAMAQELARAGNASSLHGSGRRARRVVEEARESLGALIGAGPSEIIFTSGGTEADNLAIKGLFWQRRSTDPRRRRILVSAVEHHAVLDAAQWLGRSEHGEVVLLPVDRTGRVDLDVLESELSADPDAVALVSVMWANNEVGTVQPVRELAELAHVHGVPVHCDAVQAFGGLPVDFAASGVDCLTLSGHKIGGPVGVGALVARRGLDLVPVLHGGGQERRIRSGTLDTAAIHALAVAAGVTVDRREAEAARVSALRDALVDGILDTVPDAVPHGDTAPGGRVPGIAHLTFPGCEGDSLLYLLDARGVECSTGSACQAGIPQPSHVLLAMGVPEDQARGALRFSLGWTLTTADVEAAVEAIGAAVARARRAGLAGVAPTAGVVRA